MHAFGTLPKCVHVYLLKFVLTNGNHTALISLRRMGKTGLIGSINQV